MPKTDATVKILSGIQVLIYVRLALTGWSGPDRKIRCNSTYVNITWESMVLFLVAELFLKIAIEITFTTDIFWSKQFSQNFLQPLFLNILCQDFPFRVLFGSSNDRLPAAAWLPTAIHNSMIFNFSAHFLIIYSAKQFSKHLNELYGSQIVNLI